LGNLKYSNLISGGAFVVAFLMAIVLFTGYGRSLISSGSARTIFMISGAIGFFVNFASFQQGKHSPIYSSVFWGSCMLVFAGLVFRILHWPFSDYITIAGLCLLAISFFLPSKRSDENKKDQELLDNF